LNGGAVLDAKGHEVAETWGNQFAKMVLPDAAFIVTAVNAHDKLTADRDELLKALELARDNLQFLPPNYVVEKIDAAIAQAKEQP
jgi:hypothetical protein